MEQKGERGQGGSKLVDPSVSMFNADSSTPYISATCMLCMPVGDS